MSWEKSSVLSLNLFTEKFRLKKHVIYETIISTFKENINTPHAAPMGIIFENDYVLIKPYKTSRTYKYMKKNRYATINFINDLEIFYKLSLEDKNMEEFKDFFEIISEFNTPILKNADLSIEIKVIEDLTEKDIRANFKCEPLHYIYNIKYREQFEPINRAKGCVLEAIIHSTRVSLYRKLDKPELKAKINDLIFLLKYYRRIIKKVYPNSKYIWIIEDIFKRLNIED